MKRTRTTTRRRTPLLLLVAVLAAPVRAPASQDSERLVAQGEAAFQAGRYDDARARFERAVAADGRDASATYDLGLALGKLGRWDEAERAFGHALDLRPDFPEARDGLDLARAHARESGGTSVVEPARHVVGTAGEAERAGAGPEVPVQRAWSLHATTGIQYDSNVTIEPRGRQASDSGGRGDVAFLLGAGGRYDVLDRPDLLLRVEYDFYQTLHPRLADFDFQSHRVRGTVGYALTPDLWAGLQGGYNYYSLGRNSYLNEPYFNPFLSLLESTWGLTQLSYRRADDTYLSRPFHDLRDEPVDTIGVIQTVYDGARYLTAGYEFGVERPGHDSRRVPATGTELPKLQPSDYELQSHQAHVGVGFPAWWRTSVDLTYLFRYEDYTRPNSRANFTKTRQDSGHHMYASLTHPITDALSVAVSYYGTVNLSNIPVFDYRRNVASVVLQVAF